ncbi:PPM-type phosphatase domain superfamily [Arabidopsis suecica]|jgi:serine/threonine protein phosphatase PrpC|uniref:Probable protein phosphatase 2C 73 n=2 Tax=Arabidopsis TaxID=3701 RepID=P2C73_ARATH|nr:Protein phosphatase 2C family protein [Arabidopsis thaliana]NP_851086.1 Protein phosphatase 2C family protein [Arabidopsis thaliana]Q0WRB2.1 RecName: Full=Probable protein phosphatase 2C 73; Short=AtPP2C73; AltName: Full=AtPPC6;7 [Arabidopsis thaliana]KAG7610640.1 PPM-type phosphatase domain superfamily [Arabidopsis suecica]ABH04570.1 At5g27930 [Arabidopsis thaliana]AED93745.1 Protein phosphatase 2C family protein [Arabidopsis thaliana]AED93746.1 Protein phosphatase 2C family protein [Arab|eukprot:NP_568503.1 Protein phosphatase 2C family protein [Arabidopsis thaliana]
MGHFSSMFNGLARSFSIKKVKNNNGNCDAKEAADEMASEAKKKELILKSSGYVNVQGSNNLASLFSKRGEKGVNQDCALVWEGFGCQEDMIFCGIFDGHGPWGHYVAKQVRNSMPLSLLCNWQKILAQATLEPELDLEGSNKKISRFDIWKQSYLKTCATVDQELEHHRKIDSYYSGTTALTIVRQGEVIYVANVGDSRAVLAMESDEGSLVAVQLTLDFKPNLPQEKERIIGCKGRVFCLDDEPGVHRVWQPDAETPGLAMSRAFGDYCIKEYGLVSVPEVTQRHISTKDHFIILASDGIWDVISNQEAIEIVSSTAERPKAAKRLVEQAVRAWKKKRRGYSMDDMSVVCLFLHSSSSSSLSQHHHAMTILK